MSILTALAVLALSQDPTPPGPPPLKTVTLELNDAPLEDAIKALEEQSGIPTAPPYSAKQKIALSLKDATPLQACDEICRKAKGVTYNVQELQAWDSKSGKSVSQGVRIVFMNGIFRDAPASLVRHYKISVDNLALNRNTDFTRDRVEGSLVLRILWTPDVPIEAIRLFRIEEIVDDQERSLFTPETNQWSGVNKIQQQAGWFQAATTTTFSFKFPEAGVKKLACVKGTAVARFPSKVESVLFEIPADSADATKDVRGLSVKLKSFKVTGSSAQAVVEMGGKFEPPADPYLTKAPLDAWSARFPFTGHDFALVTDGGAKVKPASVSTSTTDKTTTYTISYTLPDKATARSIRCDVPVEYLYDELPFELRDVRLP